MYRLEGKIEADIWYNPVFYNDLLVFNKADKTVHVYDVNTLSPIKMLVPDNVTYITIKNNSLYLSTSAGVFLFNIGDLSSEGVKIPNVGILPAYINDEFIFSNYKAEYALKIARYNYRTFTLEALFNYQIGRNILGVNDRLVFPESKIFAGKIFCIDQITGEEYWVFDVNESRNDVSYGHVRNEKIQGALHAYGNSVVIPLSGNKILNVDCQTGQVNWSVENVNALLKIHGDRIINVTNSNYREISLGTGEIIVEYDMKSVYDRSGFYITGPLGDFMVTDTHIFVTHARGSRIGCINRGTGEMDWFVEVGDGKVVLNQPPVFYRDRVYVVDDRGILHVYAKA